MMLVYRPTAVGRDWSFSPSLADLADLVNRNYPTPSFLVSVDSATVKVACFDRLSEVQILKGLLVNMLIMQNR
jgi:hypothetical protein